MPFQMSPIGFVNDILIQVNAIRQDLLGNNLPATLFHYTSLQGVLGIAESRIVRATSAAELSDKSEIHHGIKLVEIEIDHAIHNGASSTAGDILRAVPNALRNRISRAFVACFCANAESKFHWGNYGHYCLRFETDQNREPLLRISVSGAQVGYYKAIYGDADQQNAIRQSIKAIIAAITHNTRGTLDGCWPGFPVNFLARNISELLLDLVVAFKDRKYLDDEEWRLVVRPNSGLASSAPDLIDRNFDVIIKKGSRNYVELQMVRPTIPFVSLSLRAPIPFTAVVQSPSADPAELKIIRNIINKNGRPDIPVEKILASNVTAN